jgi:hypothetical protein
METSLDMRVRIQADRVKLVGPYDKNLEDRAQRRGGFKRARDKGLM